jgi:hypothetical protein
MSKLIGTPVDRKNIGLAKLLSILRQDLDIYCLISVNADSITQRGIGSSFFGRIQGLVIESIALSIYKIYEKEKNHELNSIHGIFRHLSKDALTTLDDEKLKEFIQNYNGLLIVENPIYSLESTIKRFRKKYRHELDRFETFRKKKVAHDEFGFTCKSLPSYDVMQKLFFFGADFYGLVSRSFVGVTPHNFKSQALVKTALINVFHELGIEDIKTEME